MKLMGTFETNNIDVDNIAQTFVDSPDNIATSDELSPEESFFRKEDTSYAKKKRDDALLLKTSTTIGFSLTVILGGVALTNAFTPDLPIVQNISQVIEQDTLHYSFEIKNRNKYFLTYVVQVNHEDFEGGTIVLEKDGFYDGEIVLPSFYVGATITSSFKAQLVDYTKTINEYMIQEGANHE